MSTRAADKPKLQAKDRENSPVTSSGKTEETYAVRTDIRRNRENREASEQKTIPPKLPLRGYPSSLIRDKY